MRNIHCWAFALLISTPFLACNKGADEGNATLRITPRHHSRVIDSCMVYIKYGSKDVAVSYDDSVKVVLDAGEQVAIFSKLRAGDYYLFGKGWDPVIKDTVIGGLPFEIAEEKVYAISLPVTEGD